MPLHMTGLTALILLIGLPFPTSLRRGLIKRSPALPKRLTSAS